MMRKQAGFTLVELLIALTLMGLILTVVYGGMRLGMRSWEAGEAQTARVNEVRVVYDFIRRQLQQSIEIYVNTDRGRVIAFTGESQQVQLVTPLLEHLGRGGLYQVDLDRVDNGDSDSLRMRWRPFQSGVPGESLAVNEDATEEALLLNDVTALEWAYFGATQPGEAPVWAERWDNLLVRPLLVRLTLSVRGEPWPPLVVRLDS